MKSVVDLIHVFIVIMVLVDFLLIYRVSSIFDVGSRCRYRFAILFTAIINIEFEFIYL